jgi:hypothetical protein
MFGLHNIPTFDFQVQVHKMVVEAFASFDGLQQGSENQSSIEGQLMENTTIDATYIVFSIDLG